MSTMHNPPVGLK